MAIPQYEQHITPDATQATTPEELHPVAAAFGGDIGAALEKSGSEVADRIQTLSLHMARMNFYRGEAQKVDLANNYKQSLHDQVIGDPSNPNARVTYTPNANTKGLAIIPGATGDPSNPVHSPGSFSNTAPIQEPIDKPLGVLNWKGNMAHGALDYLDQWHQQAQTQIANQAKGLGLRNLGSLQRDIQDSYTSQRDVVAAHEAKQINDAQVATYMKGMQLDAENAITAQNPIGLKNLLNSISAKNDLLQSSQYGDDNSNPEKQIMSDLTLNKMHTAAINNYMTANLKMNGGDPTQAQATLDKLNSDGTINDTIHDQASLRLQQLSKSIIAQNETAVKTQAVNYRMNTIQSALQGKLDFSNPNTLSEISAKDLQLGEALESHNNNKNSNIKDNDEDFASLTQKIFSSGSKEEINKYTMQALKEPNISQDRLNVLVGAACDRGKNLPDLDGQSKASNPLQNLYDQGMKVLFGTNANEAHPNMDTLVDYMKQVKEGKTVPEAIQHAQGQDAVTQNPHLLNIPPNGQIFHDKYGNRRIVYPDLHTEAIGGKTATKTEGESDVNSNSGD